MELIPVDEVMAFFADRKAIWEGINWPRDRTEKLGRMFMSVNAYLNNGTLISDNEGNLREPSQVEPRV